MSICIGDIDKSKKFGQECHRKLVNESLEVKRSASGSRLEGICKEKLKPARAPYRK